MTELFNMVFPVPQGVYAAQEELSRSVLYPVDLTHQLGKVLKSQGLRELCLRVRVDLEDQGVRAYRVGCTCKRKNHLSLSRGVRWIHDYG